MMKNIGRRLFASALPAMPFAAPRVGGAHLLGTMPEGKRAFSSCAQQTDGPSTNREHLERFKKLDAARSFLYDDGKGKHIDYFHRRKNNWTVLDPNVLALRSVSDQHKIHMHIAAEEKMDEERRTWQQSILEMFGLDSKRDRHELF